MSRNVHHVLGLLLVLALTMAACAPAEEPRDEAAPDDTAEPEAQDTPDQEQVDRLRLAAGDWGYPSPFAYVRGPGMIHTGFMFDTLLWRDSTGEEIPWLATDWEASEDGLEWRFTLREGVTFHDGEPLTADDVVFSFEYLKNGPGAEANVLHARSVQPVEEVVAESPTEVVFRLSRPIATFEDATAGMWGLMIIPEHIWADVDDPVRFRDEQAFIGSGPYRLEEFDEAEGTALYVANEDFFLGPPVVQRLEFVPAPDELLALERGELSAAAPHEEGVPEAQREALEAQFEVLEDPGEWNLALHFNLNEGFPYDQVEFRQAIAYAIDRQDMVDRILLGQGEPGSSGGLAPANPWTADDLPAYDHDPEQASELLDELGLEDTDGDGVRELPDGEPFVQPLLASQRFSPRAPELVGEYLREVGIQVEVQMLDRAAADEAGSQGNYQMSLIGYGGIGGDPNTLRERYSSQVPGMSFNRAHGYENAELDELADAQLGAIDENERQEMVDQMQHILAEDLPVLSLYVPTRATFFDPEVFDAWYYTPGCPPCGATRNKHMFVTGQEAGGTE
jgi:peptide/nickel transport system substrate-binding protein